MDLFPGLLKCYNSFTLYLSLIIFVKNYFFSIIGFMVLIGVTQREGMWGSNLILPIACYKAKVAQLSLTLCNPMDYTVHGILQANTLEWVASPFSRDRIQVSYIVGRFFTSWAIREAQEYWSGQPIPSPADLSDPGIELGFPALQADSLPTELPGKATMYE